MGSIQALLATLLVVCIIAAGCLGTVTPAGVKEIPQWGPPKTVCIQNSSPPDCFEVPSAYGSQRLATDVVEISNFRGERNAASRIDCYLDKGTCVIDRLVAGSGLSPEEIRLVMTQKEVRGSLVVANDLAGGGGLQGFDTDVITALLDGGALLAAYQDSPEFRSRSAFSEVPWIDRRFMEVQRPLSLDDCALLDSLILLAVNVEMSGVVPISQAGAAKLCDRAHCSCYR